MDSGLIADIKKVAVPIVTAAEMRANDAYSIANEPISSLDLLERASNALYNAFKKYISHQDPLHFIIGPGNNGGDGLCMARLAMSDGFTVKISTVFFDKPQSKDNVFQCRLIQTFAPNMLKPLAGGDLLQLAPNEIVVDCVFGTGLNSAVMGEYLKLIHKINGSGNTVFSIDIPSGLFTDNVQADAPNVQAKKTITVQAPKPSFFYAENKIDFEIVNAGIQTKNIAGNHFFLSPQDPYKSKLMATLPTKDPFGHKGSFGHALIVGGNKGMYGSVAMAAKSCIAAGAGLTTVLAPLGANMYLSQIPQAMHIEKPLNKDTLDSVNIKKFSVLAIGPGLGTNAESADFLKAALMQWNQPVILDADALNILAIHDYLWEFVKPGSLLTPHPTEYKRLFGNFNTGVDLIQKSLAIANEKQVFILAKNKYSMFFTPTGDVFHNGSGSAALAQGGSGDTLTGAIAGLAARTHDLGFAGIYGAYLAGF